MKNINTILLPQLLLASPGLAAASSDTKLKLEDPAYVDAVIDGYIERETFPFVYVRLEDLEGRVIYEHSAINDELMGGMKIDGDSWIRIWSMSKAVTISVVLDLVEDGTLSLTDRVVDYIPEFSDLQVAALERAPDLSLAQGTEDACPFETVPMQYGMTLLDLLNHRGGFYYPNTGVDCLDETAFEADLPTARNSQDLIDRIATLPLVNQPGATAHYGVGTTVLGLVAERATGKSLNQLVEARVTGPFGIEGLRYGLPEGAELPPHFTAKDGVLRKMDDDGPRIFGSELPGYDPESELYLGGEGMVATANGYADFARILLGRGELGGQRLLDESTIADLTAPHTQLDSEFGHNGYNLWISNGLYGDGEQGPGPLWIGGGYEGTHFWIDPQRGFVGVIMSQIFETSEDGWGRDENIRKAIYEQLETGGK